MQSARPLNFVGLGRHRITSFFCPSVTAVRAVRNLRSDSHGSSIFRIITLDRFAHNHVTFPFHAQNQCLR